MGTVTQMSQEKIFFSDGRDGGAAGERPEGGGFALQFFPGGYILFHRKLQPGKTGE